MQLASIIDQYHNAFIVKYADRVLPGHLNAINAIRSCRTPDCGELYVQCTDADCNHAQWRPLSCGHRNCPKCQNHQASQWIDRQQAKLLPVPYFLATFTLPYQLRSLTWYYQKIVFSIFFLCVSSTLKDFGLNPKNLGAEIAMTMVLHTHNRRLDFHPHIHVVVPGGGVDKRLSIPKSVPSKWVVDCEHVGKGITALKYLSRYLYRGVISEKNIVSNQNGQVTFKYIESKTGNTRYRTLKGEDFLHLIIQHVLPKGFRRVRDYGFLHGNAKKMLLLVQLILHVVIKGIELRPRPVFKCPCCNSPMAILGFRKAACKPG